MTNMLAAPAMAMPARIVAGDSLKVDRVDLATDYPVADGYALSYRFAPVAGGTPVTVAAGDGTTRWSLIVDASVTAEWAAGDWRWSAQITKGSDRLTADSGTLAVEADPTAANVDSRSHARKVLSAIEAAIEGRASKTDLETTFADGRQIKRLTHAELVDLRKYYAGLVVNEDRRAGRTGPGRVLMRL
jgi:hypothetical protein